jgi:hypothetical protein
LSTLSDAIRSVVAPAALVQEQADVTAPDPTDIYTADDMPEVAVIAAAAAEFERSADLARHADRGKRAAKKVLDRLPAGLYGGWLVSRTPSSRQVADLAEITRIFKANGLGSVPMKTCAASLKVSRAEVLTEVAA